MGRCAPWGIFVPLCVGGCVWVRPDVYLCFDVLVDVPWGIFVPLCVGGCVWVWGCVLWHKFVPFVPLMLGWCALGYICIYMCRWVCLRAFWCIFVVRYIGGCALGSWCEEINKGIDHILHIKTATAPPYNSFHFFSFCFISV